MVMRDKKRGEGIKNVDKREKVKLFTKKEKGKPERWKRNPESVHCHWRWEDL